MHSTTASKYEAISKAIVIVSLLGAELLANVFAFYQNSVLPILSLAGFVLSLFFGRLFPARVGMFLTIILLSFPAISFLLFRETYGHYIPLTSAFIGLLVSKPSLQWHFPEHWKLPLALVVLLPALSWPVVLYRELHFGFDIRMSMLVSNNWNGFTAFQAALWVLNMTVIQITGFLWLDWLFQTFQASGDKQFRRLLLLPFFLGFLPAIVVAVYQALFRIDFLNTSYWIDYARASGTLMDANPFGILSALLGSAAIAYSWKASRRLRAPLMILILALTCIGVSLSGSRSAFLIWLFMLGFYLWSARKHAEIHLQWIMVGALPLLLVVLFTFSFSLSTPLIRISTSFFDEANLPQFLMRQFDNRLLLGYTAMYTASDYPLTGTGVGTFSIACSDFTRRYGNVDHPLQFENALNWYLHQLSEYGLIGALGWFTWIVAFLFGFQKIRQQGDSYQASAIGWTLVAFGLASFIGVHTQKLEVLLLFWTLVFWLTFYLAPRAMISGSRVPFAAPSHKGWIAVLVLSVVYTGVLALESARTLSITARAADSGWQYSYGFYPWEENPSIGRFRWTKLRAAVLVKPEQPWIEIPLLQLRPDIASKPVEVSIRVDDKMEKKIKINSHSPVISKIRLPDQKRAVLLSIEVDSVWKPSDYGFADERKLGVAVGEWKFLTSAD